MATKNNGGKGQYVGSSRIRLPLNPFHTATTTERNAIPAADRPEGTVVYDTTLNQLVLHNGSAWVNVDGTALA